MGIPPDTATVDDALQAYTAVIFQPLVSRTYLENNKHLMIWYMVKVLEVLSRPPLSRVESFTLDTLPRELTPRPYFPWQAVKYFYCILVGPQQSME